MKRERYSIIYSSKTGKTKKYFYLGQQDMAKVKNILMVLLIM